MHQVRILGAADGQLLHLRVGLLDRLLVDLLLGRDRRVAQEVDREVEEPLVLGVGQHVLHRADDALGLEVAAAHAERAGVERRSVVQFAIARQLGVGGAPGVLAVLEALAEGGPDLSQHRQVDCQRLVQALEHGDALLALEDACQQVAREGPEHHHVDDAHLDAARLAQVVGDRLGGRHQAALAQDQVVGVVGSVGHHPPVATSRQLVELGERALGQLLDVVEEERALSGDALHVGVLVLDQARHDRVVDVPEQRDAAALLAVEDALGGCGRVDHVVRAAQVLGDQGALGHEHRLDQVRGQEAVLRDGAGVERQLGDAVGDDVQVGRRLRVAREQLEEPGVVDAVVVVVPGVHVQGRLGHRAGTDVEHVGEPLSHRGVERLVHVGDALSRREVGRSQPRHGHARRHRRRRVLPLRLDEDQRTPGDVDVPGGRRLGPVLAHLGRRRDRVGAGRVGRLALAHDDGGVAVHRGAHAGVLEVELFLLLPTERQNGHRNSLGFEQSRYGEVSRPTPDSIRSGRRGGRPCG
jgi:hypothetical protein